MQTSIQQRQELQTPHGAVEIRSFCPPDEIRTLSLVGTFKEYARYHPIISKTESLAKAAGRPDANVTLAVTEAGAIVGFAILQYSSRDERWARVGERMMMEVAVVEVSRAYRGAGVAGELLRLLLDHPLKEDRIFYMVGYSWTWDLEEIDITPIEYRNLLVELFEKFGFRIYQTNEPNIMMRPENLFMARIGKNIPETVFKRFKRVLFNIDIA